MKEYPKIIIPEFARKPFFDFTKRDAQDYFDWFLEIKSERLKILIDNIKIHFNDWEPDFSRESLNKLYMWFCNNVSIRPTTKEEKQEQQEQFNRTPLLAKNLELNETTLSDDTVSICFDIGLYFGECCKKNINGMEWTFILKPARYIHFAQPILLKNKKKYPDFNPRYVIEGMVGGVIHNKVTENEFITLFDWNIKNFAKY